MGIDFSFYLEYKKNDKWCKHPFQFQDTYRGSVLDSAMRKNNIGQDWCEFPKGSFSPGVEKEIGLYTEWFYVLSRDNVSSIISALRKEDQLNWTKMALVLDGLLKHMKDDSRVIAHGM